MKIEKGKKYRCLYWEGCYFTGGNYYVSDKDGYLVNNNGVSLLIVSTIENFELAEEPSTEDLLKRIEALDETLTKVSFELSKLIVKDSETKRDSAQTIVTVSNFKRIADHAQAITNEIATPKEDVIYVPDGILDKSGDILNGNHVLWFYNNDWRVSKISNQPKAKPNQFKLVPVKREDLKAGDVAFRANNYGLEYRDDLHLYCIILEDGYQFWSGRDCVFATATCKHWYKVVEC